MKKTDPKDILFYLVIVVILFVMISLLYNANKSEPPDYSSVLQDFEQEKVERFVVEGSGKLTMYMKDGSKKEHHLLSIEFFRQDIGDLIRQQHARGTITHYDWKPEWQPPWWVMFIPYVLIIVVFIALWYFMINRGGGGEPRAMSFKRANPRLVSDEKRKFTFNDVQGA